MPNDILQPLLSPSGCNPFVPKAALIVFEKNGGYPSEHYLETRQIRADGTMGAAKPVSKDFIQNILSSFSAEYRSVPHGAVPENLLYCDTRRGNERYLWYNPPMKRQRFFDERLGLKDGVYYVPGTLYLVKNGGISVWCFAGKKPKRDAPLLGVPYFNVYADGSVCMGSARADIPDRADLSYADILFAWEKAFWCSRDVHTNGSPSTKANLVETIRKYKDIPFDTKELEVRKDSLTVEKIISKLK